MVRTYINARALSFFMSSPPLLDKQKVLFDITAGEHKDIMIHEMKKHERESDADQERYRHDLNREERKCFFLVIAGLLFREKKETVWRPKEMQ